MCSGRDTAPQCTSGSSSTPWWVWTRWPVRLWIWKLLNWLCRWVGEGEEKVLSQPADNYLEIVNPKLPPNIHSTQTFMVSASPSELFPSLLGNSSLPPLWSREAVASKIQMLYAEISGTACRWGRNDVTKQRCLFLRKLQTLLKPRGSKSGSRERCYRDRKQPKQLTKISQQTGGHIWLLKYRKNWPRDSGSQAEATPITGDQSITEVLRWGHKEQIDRVVEEKGPSDLASNLSSITSSWVTLAKLLKLSELQFLCL